MQRLVAAAHRKGEDRLTFVAWVEGVGIGAERQPHEFRQRETALKFLRRLAIGDETRIEALDRRGDADLCEGMLPRVDDEIGTARPQVEIGGKVNRSTWTRAQLHPKKRVAGL